MNTKAKQLLTEMIISSNGYSEAEKQQLMKRIDKFELETEPDAETLWKTGILIQKIARMNPETCDVIYRAVRELYEESAKRGNADALRSLGQFYMMGYGVEKDENKAFEYYNKAAELGNTTAQIDIGVSYYLGTCVEKNRDTALMWFRKAAESGDANALWQMGSFYVSEKRFEEALLWFQRAADAGCDQGFYTLAGMYRDGYGVEKDAKKGFEYLLKGAQNGEPDSQCCLAIARIEGKFGDYDVEQDAVHSIDLLRSAVEADNLQACYCYGKLLVEGEYIEQNIQYGIMHLTFAASNYFYDAQIYLGSLYYEGDIVEQDPEKCFYWIQEAAETGKAEALQFLALLYFDGFGVEENHEKGIELLKKCIDLGDETSQQVLDLYYKQLEGEVDSQGDDNL